ncbi:MAG: ferredoxin family protein [Candidatus Marinimicrobia bacterium]|jgi:2-oxoglutarate ferredoxin oxidoreductase subunit delta|nr:ferredoxin family protein [Candidatus Neomarinimicrobiota bacterium]MBT3839986.1 ferredoxin family protein [Candidatus Neomarinimicrobiota bacterium]MBT3999258.1 ferredoxin family protein [Candidatus Neomarinimicrobiota bacterium]MBT4282183.1 ferredoxin family protein [Candidatus Neomarinimicrobiota bacterium]MBT4579859.1 ferredoxin family protein [Candidatus Neomarinimicrobiota bacterium]
MTKSSGHIIINIQKCKGCELCIIECPQNGMALSSNINQNGYHYAYLAEDICTGCTNCALICPEAIIKVYRKKKSKILKQPVSTL